MISTVISERWMKSANLFTFTVWPGSELLQTPYYFWMWVVCDGLFCFALLRYCYVKSDFKHRSEPKIVRARPECSGHHTEDYLTWRKQQTAGCNILRLDILHDGCRRDYQQSVQQHSKSKSDTDLPQNVWLIKEQPSTHRHYSSALGQTMKDKNQSFIYKMGCVNANCLTGMFQTRVCVPGNIYNVVSHVSLYMSARVTGNAK